MTKTYEDVVKQLGEDIPRKAVASRQGGNGKSLDYLQGWYVIDRMNQVFGQGNWAYNTNGNPTCVYAGEVDDNGKSFYFVSYTASVQLTANFPMPAVNGVEQVRQVKITDVGYGDGRDNKIIGKAHELAIKESVTDALKRCAKSLGMSMGLALYDKTQEFVSDDESDREIVKATIPTKVIAASATSTETGRDTYTKAIAAASAVAIAKKKATKTALVTHLKTKYNVEKKEALTADQAKEFVAYLNTLITEGKTNEQSIQ